MSDRRPDSGDRVPAAEAVVAEALAAFEAQDWSRLVELTDAGSVGTLRMQYLDGKRTEGTPAQFAAAEELLGCEVPESVKEAARGPLRFGELAGITTLEQAEALTEAEFLVRWAQARHPHYLVDGIAPWNNAYLERRAPIGSVAFLPDTVAVVVRATHLVALNTLAGLSMIAVIGDNQGGWALDASSGWLGLADIYF